MFERGLEDPAKDAIRRLAGLFQVAAIGLAVGGVLFVLANGRAYPLFAGLYLGFALLCAVGAWATANGIERRKRWARNAGLVIAFLSLVSVPVGTIFGIIELYSLWRAQRGGQFSGNVDAA
jgi:hypothetical protein